MKEELLAGWGEADITPDEQVVELFGQYYERLSQGIHSRLKTVALVLARGDKRVIMVSIDCAGAPADLCRRLEQAIAGRVPELSAAALIVNATHTHNAPSLERGFNWWEPDPKALTCEAFRNRVEAKVIEAVEGAWKSRQPSGMANVLDYARAGHCRRAVYSDGTAEMYGRTDRDDFIGMEGCEDSGVDLMFFFDTRRRPTGVIVNLACPSQVMESTYVISSDFMGALRERLKAEYGPDFRTLCQVSAAGDQSPRDLTRNYRGEPDFWHADGVEALAERLLAAVKRAYLRAFGTIVTDPVLAHKVVPLSLPKRRVSEMEYEAARREVARLEAIRDSAGAYRDFCATVHRNEKIPGRPGPHDDKLMHFVLIRNAEAVVNRHKEQATAPDVLVPVSVVRLGNAAFASNPFELYLEFGQRLKARSLAEQTFVVQLANGVGGYLPSRRAEELGGYGGLVINGQIGSAGGSKLVDETLAAVRSLW